MKNWNNTQVAADSSNISHRDELAIAINGYKLWDQPKEEREEILQADSEMRDEILQMLIEYKFGLDFVTTEKAYYVDCIAFMEAFEKSVKYYNAKKDASFITYFINVYDQCKSVDQNNNNEHGGINNLDDASRTVKDLVKLIKTTQVKGEFSSIEETIEFLKEQPDVNHKQDTWDAAYQKIKGMIHLDKVINRDDEDGDTTLMDIIEDYSVQSALTSFEIMEDIIDTILLNIKTLQRASQSTMYRYFITRKIMVVLKDGEEIAVDQQYPDGVEDVYDLLKPYEPKLRDKILKQDYIEHVVSADPEDIKTLYGAYNNFQKKTMNQDSLAPVMDCSKANVSKRIKKVLEKLNELN